MQSGRACVLASIMRFARAVSIRARSSAWKQPVALAIRLVQLAELCCSYTAFSSYVFRGCVAVPHRVAMDMCGMTCTTGDTDDSCRF
jgi:hypothetical protein